MLQLLSFSQASVPSVVTMVIWQPEATVEVISA